MNSNISNTLSNAQLDEGHAIAARYCCTVDDPHAGVLYILNQLGTDHETLAWYAQARGQHDMTAAA